MSPKLTLLLILLIVLGLGLWARSTFRRVQGPGRTAQRHVREHVDWMKGELAMSDSDGGDVDEPN